MKYLLYPYYTEESATCWGTPVAVLDELPPDGEMSHDLVALCAFGMQGAPDKANKYKTLDELKAMTTQEIADWVDDAIVVNFDKIAVIEDVGERRQDIEKFSDMLLLSGAGSDSSAYAAASAFAGYLESTAVLELDFPLSTHLKESE